MTVVMLFFLGGVFNAIDTHHFSSFYKLIKLEISSFYKLIKSFYKLFQGDKL
jgi:hypothetical protein